MSEVKDTNYVPISFLYIYTRDAVWLKKHQIPCGSSELSTNSSIHLIIHVFSDLEHECIIHLEIDKSHVDYTHRDYLRLISWLTSGFIARDIHPIRWGTYLPIHWFSNWNVCDISREESVLPYKERHASYMIYEGVQQKALPTDAHDRMDVDDDNAISCSDK